MKISTITAIGWSLICLGSSIAFSSMSYDFLLIAYILFVLIAYIRSIDPLKAFITISLPFLLPIIFIHTFINPGYEISGNLWRIPIRQEGFYFAIKTYSNLAVYISVAICWWNVDRDEFVDWIIARKVKFFIIAIIMQSVAYVPLIEKRGISVLKAQTARGIAIGPSISVKARALLSLILPVVTSLINEGEQRSVALWSRGFGRYKLETKNKLFCTKIDLLLISIIAAWPLSYLVIRKIQFLKF